MVELGIAGKEQFLLGFRLAGVRRTFKVDGNPMETIKNIMEMKEIGILVLDEETMSELPEYFREELDRSVDPVVVMLSDKGESSSLRDKIIRSIGVDLWKGD